MRYAEGANFTIDVEDGIAVCRLFKAQINHEALARAGRELVGVAKALTKAAGVTGMVVDLRRVPGAAAPEIADSYGALAEVWEATAQRVAFLVLDDPLQGMQLTRVLHERAPRCSAVLQDRNEARSFAGATQLGPATKSSAMFELSRLRKP